MCRSSRTLESVSGNGDEDENGDPDERLQRLAEQAWSRETAIGDDADAFGRDPAVAELRERLAGTPPPSAPAPS